MITELRKRIITSIILFIFAVLCISINQNFFMATSIVIAIVCFVEWGKINKLNEKKALKSFIIIVPAFIYLFIILQFSTFALRGESLESVIFFYYYFMYMYLPQQKITKSFLTTGSY